MFKQIQAYVIFDRSYRSFCSPLCHLWGLTKIVKCHLKYCLVKNGSWRTAVDFWTQKTDLPMLGKQEKDPWNSLGNEAIHETKTVMMYRKALRRKGQFSRDRNCQRQPFFSRNGNLLGWRVKSCRVLVLLYVHARSSGAYLIKLLFSWYMSSKTFLSSFSEFQTKKCLWCVSILLWVVKYTLSKFCSAKRSRSIAALSRLVLSAWENYSSQRTSQARHAGISHQD